MVNDDDGTVTKTEVDNLNSVSIYPYKRRRLPREIVFEILLRLPAQVIHDKRHVYEEWRLMTGAKDFIHSHLRNSTPGIIIMEDSKNYGIYVEMRRGCLEICKFDCGSYLYLVGKSVNGLALGTPGDKRSREKQILYVFNPLTKQQVAVPYGASVISGTALAFAEASMKYKVVRSCRLKSSWCVGLLTIGADKEWRYIDIEHISMQAQWVLGAEPLVTRGYVHWIDTPFVLTLNVETEIIYEFAKPEFPVRGFLAMGHNLSSYYLSQRPQSLEYLMEVREMNAETGEWTMLFSSDLKPLSDRFKGLNLICVFGMLAFGEVFLFGLAGSEKLGAAYNVRTREIQWFQLEKSTSKCHGRPHVNSMVWFE